MVCVLNSDHWTHHTVAKPESWVERLSVTNPVYEYLYNEDRDGLHIKL